jgi:xylonate dehydratase
MARRSARALDRLAKRNLTTKQVLTPASIRNAMAVHAAFGGSTNLLIHLPAIAFHAGLPRPTVEEWTAINCRTGFDRHVRDNAPALPGCSGGSRATS